MNSTVSSATNRSMRVPSRVSNAAWRWCRRKPALAGLIAALHLVLALGLVGILWEWRRAVSMPPPKPNNVGSPTRIANAPTKMFTISDMSLAQHAWDEGDLGRTLSLLQAHRPRTGELDRRGFEWFYFWNLCQGDQQMTLTNHSQHRELRGVFARWQARWPLGRSETQCRFGTAPPEKSLRHCRSKTWSRWRSLRTVRCWAWEAKTSGSCGTWKPGALFSNTKKLLADFASRFRRWELCW